MNGVNRKNKIKFIVTFILFTLIVSCQKERKSVCDGKTFILNISTDSTSTDTTADGKITVLASGSTSFTYKLNYTGTYGANNVFDGLKYGTYFIYIKDDDGCEKIKQVNVIARDSCTALPGVTFTQVRNLLDAKCVSCHNDTTTNLIDYTVNCNVLQHRDSIFYRVVTVGNMPPLDTLSASEKSIITDWLNAGGKISN